MKYNIGCRTHVGDICSDLGIVFRSRRLHAVQVLLSYLVVSRLSFALAPAPIPAGCIPAGSMGLP